MLGRSTSTINCKGWELKKFSSIAINISFKLSQLSQCGWLLKWSWLPLLALMWPLEATWLLLLPSPSWACLPISSSISSFSPTAYPLSWNRQIRCAGFKSFCFLRKSICPVSLIAAMRLAKIRMLWLWKMETSIGIKLPKILRELFQTPLAISEISISE